MTNEIKTVTVPVEEVAAHIESLGAEFFYGERKYAASGRIAVANAVRAKFAAAPKAEAAPQAQDEQVISTRLRFHAQKEARPFMYKLINEAADAIDRLSAALSPQPQTQAQDAALPDAGKQEDQAAFITHLNKASETVKGWPSWKRAEDATGRERFDAWFKDYKGLKPQTLVTLIDGYADMLKAYEFGRASISTAQLKKDHEVRELVNDLANAAREFHNTQQLRERIAHLVVPFIKGE